MIVIPIPEIELRLCSIAKRIKICGVNAGSYERLGIVEWIAHELAHLVDLDMDAGFESRLSEMGDAEANDREASALRVEISTLASLGVRLSMRRLWATANWRVGTGAPSISRLRSPITRRERRLADQLVSMVIAEGDLG